MTEKIPPLQRAQNSFLKIHKERSVLLLVQFRNRFTYVHILPGFQQLAPPLPYYMIGLTHLITGVLSYLLLLITA